MQVYYWTISVVIECGKLVVLAAILFMHKLYGNFSSVKFSTITTNLLSLFIKAVVNNWSRFDELMTLFAPGLTNFEKWPM